MVPGHFKMSELDRKDNKSYSKITNTNNSNFETKPSISGIHVLIIIIFITARLRV